MSEQHSLAAGLSGGGDSTPPFSYVIAEGVGCHSDGGTREEKPGVNPPLHPDADPHCPGLPLSPEELTPEEQADEARNAADLRDWSRSEEIQRNMGITTEGCEVVAWLERNMPWLLRFIRRQLRGPQPA